MVSILKIQGRIVYPDSKIHGDNMGPTWVLPAPGGSHVGPWNLLSGYVFLTSERQGWSPHCCHTSLVYHCRRNIIQCQARMYMHALLSTGCYHVDNHESQQISIWFGYTIRYHNTYEVNAYISRTQQGNAKIQYHWQEWMFSNLRQ